MKRVIIAVVSLCLLMSCITVFAQDDIMKIAMSGNTITAKDIGTGKGVSFTLPELENDEFYIYAIELAVFEKHYEENNWHIYTDDDGNESKKQYIENPDSLTFNVDFGNPKDYRDETKYKIGYRYYIQSIYDTSQMMIAGEDVKDGWRLVGEDVTTEASDDGFGFYRNALPTMHLECFSYKYHDVSGLMTDDCSPSQLSERYFPYDAFENGVTVQMIANDFDREDILTVSYRLEDAMTDAEVVSGTFSSDFKITTDHKTELFRLYITVTDNFGGSITSEPFLFMMDLQKPTVTSEFNDGGYALKGKNLFSDFYIDDDSGEVMTERTVFADVYLNDELVDSVELENRGNGVFRLDKTGMADGEYTVHLKMYDKAGNEGEHYFYQTLDNTAPTLTFVTPEQNSNATYYSTWMNVSKNIIINITDQYAGFKRYRLYLDGTLMISGSYGGAPLSATFNRQVSQTKTGKLQYSFYAYDDAKGVNKTSNSYSNVTGNYRISTRYVWLDKTKPTITTSHEDNLWKEAPYTITANFYDYPSSNSVNDASGVKEKMYAITTSADAEPEWITYTDGVAITEGGVYYVHFKAVDNAGNVQVVTQRVRVNAKSQINGRVRPTEEYKHTIYYSTPGFYVVKNTAYNTKYHFELKDFDISDVIKTSVKLVSQDDSSVFGVSESITQPTGTEDRDIVFNMPYLDAELNELPDGVYDMLITITEIKNDNEEVVTHVDFKDCEVVIKRNAPPTPVINTSGDKVSITYPDEPLAGSLNNSIVKSHYKCQYKTVKDGEAETNTYKTYTGEFDADNFIVTALYTDIAGNTSVATKRIYGDSSDAGGTGDILTSGNTITVEESRAADVYYIGIRRDKKSGINNSVFDFLE